MSAPTFTTLLDDLFAGDFTSLQAQLQPLSAAERKALYAEFKPLLPLLRRACRYRFGGHTVKLSELHWAIRSDPAQFRAQQADTLTAAGALYGGIVFDFNTLAAFFLRLQALYVGLASRSGVVTGFARNDQYPVRWDAEGTLQLGTLLLARPEAWIPAALVQVVTALERSTGRSPSQGAAELVRRARQQHPDWQDTLAPVVGVAMRLDGFIHADRLAEYDTAMILAGLAQHSAHAASGSEPVLLPETCKVLVQLTESGHLPRADLLGVCLHRLQQPLRPSVARGWVALVRALQPTAADYAAQTDSWLDLLNAPSDAAARFAANSVQKHLLGDPARVAELAATLAYVLQHPSRTVAQGALKLCKALAKSHPDQRAAVVAQAVAGLASPYEKLRADLIAWLARGQRADFSCVNAERLADLLTALPVGEREPLRALLPELFTATPPEPARRQVLTPVEDIPPLPTPADAPLTLPTHAADWLHPGVLVERLTRLPARHLILAELTAALYRLPTALPARVAAWSSLTPLLTTLPTAAAQALTVALAPLAPAQSVLGGLLQTTLGGLLHDEARLELLLAALSGRPDLDPAAYPLWQRLPQRLAGGWFSHRRRAPLDWHSAAQLLSTPQPLTPLQLTALFPGSKTYFSPLSVPPLLLPYLLAQDAVFCAERRAPAELVRHYPLLTQRLFEAGLCRQQAKTDHNPERTHALLALGHLPQVTPGAQLGTLVQLAATLPKPQPREQCVELLLHWLHDGRVALADLAALLATTLHRTDKGFAALEQTLNSLAADADGQQAVLAALEQTLAQDLSGFAPKKLGSLLTLLAALLHESGRTLDHPAARATLDALAAAPKASTVRAKARALQAQITATGLPS